jgi:DNA-binding transcriptional LysR family regulator
MSPNAIMSTVQLERYLRAGLTPRALRLVVALDDVRHVGRVAAFLHVTQPAVSKSLGELERGMGVRLFERTTLGLRPTAFGACLVHHARVLLASLGHAC